jgi:hypothetical protein
MGFCSCLPCLKDKDTRHSTEEAPEKPIPVQEIIQKSNGSAKKPSLNDNSPSNAVTFSADKAVTNDRSNPTQAVSYSNKSTQFATPESTSAVSFTNERLPQPNSTTTPESNVAALQNRSTSNINEAPATVDPNNTDQSPIMADSLKSAASGVTDTVSSGAQQVGSTAQSAASAGAEKVQGGTSGTQDWEAMTEDQKKQAYDALPEGSDQKKMGYYEWVKQGYYHQKENWMPWVEDMYLRWFTRDNKASYATKGMLVDKPDEVVLTSVLIFLRCNGQVESHRRRASRQAPR